MLRVHTDHAYDAFSVNDFALVTNLFNGSSNLHNVSPILFIPIHNPAARQIVRRKLDGDLVSRKNSNEVLSHFSRDVRQHLVLVFQLDAKHRVRQRFDHSSDDFNGVFFRQLLVLPAADRHGLFWIRVVQNREDVVRHLLDRSHAVHPVISAELLVVLH